MNRALRIALRGWRKALNIATFGYFPYSDDNTVPSYWCISHAKVNEWGLAHTNLTPHIAKWEISHTNLSEPIAFWEISAEKVSRWSIRFETKDC